LKALHSGPSAYRDRFRDPGQVECFLDREPAADLCGSGDIVGRERCSCLIDELAPRSLVGVDVDDALLMGVDLRRGGDLYGRLGAKLDCLGGR
jgi:hypothetical protein